MLRQTKNDGSGLPHMDMTDQFQRVSWAFLQAQKEEDSAFARKRRVGALDGGKTRSVNLLPEIDGMESENDAL